MRYTNPRLLTYGYKLTAITDRIVTLAVSATAELVVLLLIANSHYLIDFVFTFALL